LAGSGCAEEITTRMPNHIVMLCSLDTKAVEARFLRDCIEAQGANCILVDIGYGKPPKMEASVTSAEVAVAAGTDIEIIRAMQDTGGASQLIMQGAIISVQGILREGHCDGIIAFGGASNTALATGVMKSIPVGIPKVMISSAAAMPAYAAMYFGSRDITMMHSVVDMSGLNNLTRAFLKQGAGAVCGMAECSDGAVNPPKDGKLVAVTSFRFAETCSQAVMRELESRGYSVIPFHAQGVGEDAMENLIEQGLFQGVIDIVPAGLSEQMLGGNRAARPDRLEAAGRAGIPQVIAPSGFDMISCGPISRRDDGDRLWETRGLAKRKYMIPDRYRVEARTSPSEVADIARAVAQKLNQSESLASVMVPIFGWSSLSVKGADLYDPEADAAFIPALKEALNKNIPVLEVASELNSEQFAVAMVNQLIGLIEANPQSPSA